MDTRMMLRKRIQCLRRSQTFFAKNEDGAALMIVLIVLVGLTVLATGGMILTSTQIRMSENTQAGTYAFYAADAGLAQHFGTDSSNGTDTVTYTYAQGTATVWGEKLLNVTTDSSRVLYRITSRGSYTNPQGNVTSREVSKIALETSSSGGLAFSAAFVAGAGLKKNGTSGTISGYDAASSFDCGGAPGPAIAGLTVPPDGYEQNGQGGTSEDPGEQDLVPEGEPDVDYKPSGLEALQDTGIDWAGMLDGTAVTPDYTLPGDSWPFPGLPADEWPVILVDQTHTSISNDKTIYKGGRGLLIITGDLTLNGNGHKFTVPDWKWEGVILIGGKLVMNGYTEIEGAIVTGLDQLLGDAPGADTDLGNGNKSIKYNSCAVAAATSGLGGSSGLYEEPGTWSESM